MKNIKNIIKDFFTSKVEEDKDQALLKELMAKVDKKDHVILYQIYIWYRVQLAKYSAISNGLKNMEIKLNGTNIGEQEVSDLKALLEATNPRIKEKEMEEVVAKIVNILKGKVKA